MDHLSAQEVRSPSEGLSQLLGIPGLLEASVQALPHHAYDRLPSRVCFLFS